MFVGAMAGVIAGGVFGVVLGIVVAPIRDPRQPLAHEWYMLAFFGYVLWSSIGAAIVGLIVGAVPDRRTLLGTMIGRRLGTVVGGGAKWWNTPSPRLRPYAGNTIIAFALAGAMFGTLLVVVWKVMRRFVVPGDRRFREILMSRATVTLGELGCMNISYISSINIVGALGRDQYWFIGETDG